MIDFRSLFRGLAQYPRMYVLSDTYLALVSFISGCDAATGGELLAGFDTWLAARSRVHGSTSLAWPVVVAARRWEPILDRDVTIEQIPASLQGEVKEDLMDLLEQFLREQAFDGPE